MIEPTPAQWRKLHSQAMKSCECNPRLPASKRCTRGGWVRCQAAHSASAVLFNELQGQLEAEMLKPGPVLFKGEMVREILAGRKTQTRRVFSKPKIYLPKPVRSELPFFLSGSGLEARAGIHVAHMNPNGAVFVKIGDESLGIKPGEFEWHSPYGRVGSRLYVRETWRTVELESGVDGICFRADDSLVPIANTAESGDLWVEAHDNGKHGGKWRPSIFMPAWASRLTLEITRIRVERVQDISEGDARAEGARPMALYQDGHVIGDDESFRDAFATLWESINGKRGFSWESNPWVWVYDFKRIEGQ